jgi:hypothetical protein
MTSRFVLNRGCPRSSFERLPRRIRGIDFPAMQLSYSLAKLINNLNVS